MDGREFLNNFHPKNKDFQIEFSAVFTFPFPPIRSIFIMVALLWLFDVPPREMRPLHNHAKFFSRYDFETENFQRRPATRF
jgi:hypothetical protein